MYFGAIGEIPDEAAQSVATLNLEHSHARAPFDGAVADRIASRGDFMTPGKPMFRIVNDAVLKFIRTGKPE